jgi:hypothetical protein
MEHTARTSVEDVLHIKIGISAGEVTILLLGNDESRCYLELGRAIVAANAGRDYCALLRAWVWHTKEWANDWTSICAYLPDVLISLNHLKLPVVKTFLGVGFFLDISGLTVLCERYSNVGKTGTDQLIKALNQYMGALVARILAHDGDVLKFAGDAILAVWLVVFS